MMKKIGLVVKEVSEKRIKDNIKNSGTFFIVRNAGLSGPEMNTLRLGLRNVKANMFVVKNSVARRALKGIGMDSFLKSIEEPCGFIFVNEEPVNTSKVLYTFSKEHERLKLEAAFLENRALDKKDIEALAKLPPLEVLRAQLVMALNSPISGLAIALNQVLAKFVICIDQITQKKSKEGTGGG